MKRRANGAILAGAALLALTLASAAWADVKAGVDAWGRGDYATAVHEWQGPASVGDADAMFNLAQAYRLGRGVAQDLAKAEALYAQAAAKGHLQAADTYGLMLFQDGRHEAALPYIEDAARRGDPRAEYLLGIANFNGDIVSKDWVRAYALLSMANAQGLPQATAALAQMDQQIPLAQRQQAAGLAVDMEKQANAARGRALAATDLGASVSAGLSGQRTPAPVAIAAAPSLAVPARITVSPSVAAAEAAVAEARQATGTESPALAGASFAGGSKRATQLATAAPKVVPPKPAGTHPKAPTPAPAKAAAGPTEAGPAGTMVASSAPAKVAATPAKTTPAATVVASSGGAWRVQLGAFAVRGNADRLWAQLSGRTELVGKGKVTVPAGAVTKLQAGGFASRDDADTACRSLKHSGHDCIVTR